MAKSLLVKNDDLVTITIYYKIKTNKFNLKQYKILEEQEAKELISKGDTDVDFLTTKWTIPTWQSNSHLVRSSTFYSPSEGLNRLDWSKYQDNLFKTCLKEWDVEDGGKIVPITPDSIGSLPTVIAQTLLDKYEKCLVLEDEDKKKS